MVNQIWRNLVSFKPETLQTCVRVSKKRIEDLGERMNEKSNFRKKNFSKGNRMEKREA